MNKTTYNPKPTKSPSPNNKQFPSISLTKHLQDYKPYRSIDNKKKFPDLDKNTTFCLSPEEKSLLMKNSEMPSIQYANESISEGSENVRKLQAKVLKAIGNSIRREEQFRLYMTKSQLVQGKSKQWQDIEQCLLRFIFRIVEKSPSGNLANTPSSTQLYYLRQQPSMLPQPSTTKPLLNKTTSNSIITQNKKPQPSLKVLKQQFTVINNNTTSLLDTPYNRTAINSSILHKENDRILVVEKMAQKYDEEISRLTFQRSLLQKKLQMYGQKIIKLQNRLKQEGICLQDDQGCHGVELLSSSQERPQVNITVKKASHTQQMMLNNLITQNKYKAEAQFKQIQNQTLIKELQMIKEFSFKLKMDNDHLVQKLQNITKQNDQCRQFKKYKQLWLMQCQQMIGWKMMWKEKKEENTKLGNKIKILKQKNKQLLHSFNFSMVVNPDQQEDKQQLETIIKSFQEWLKVISVPRVNCPTINPKSLIQDHSQPLKQQQYLPNPENINFKLLKPNFFIFFQAYEKTIMMEKNILNTRPLEPTFYVKLRAIQDSMYNHFISHNHFKHWPSFPQFVIGFIQKYQINFTTLQTHQRKKPIQSQQKLTFLMNLFNKKLSNTWQCDIFRSFILQEYTLDQIYFYLDCRNDLNGGPAMMHGLGTLDPVNYVKLHKAIATVQRKLVPYESYIVERVKAILKSRKKEKNGEAFIDRHFVLKLLLEVYALEKTKSERIFEASFKPTKPSKTKPTSITYTDYFTFMSKNFQYLTTHQICQLYRQTYSISSGKITFKAVHYICSSKGLFIPLIWLKRLNMNVMQKGLSNDMILLDCQNNVRRMVAGLGQCGVEGVGRLEGEVNYFLRQLDWYRNNRQVFYFKLQEIKTNIIKTNSIIDWQASTYTPNQLLSTQQIRESMLQLHSLIHQSDTSTKLLLNKKQLQSKALKQITHNFKIRIQESMREFKRVDQEQLRRLKEQVAVEIRLREMRDKGEEKKEKIVQELDQNNDGKQNAVVIGNSFLNVNDIIVGKRNQARKWKQNHQRDGQKQATEREQVGGNGLNVSQNNNNA